MLVHGATTVRSEIVTLPRIFVPTSFRTYGHATDEQALALAALRSAADGDSRPKHADSVLLSRSNLVPNNFLFIEPYIIFLVFHPGFLSSSLLCSFRSIVASIESEGMMRILNQPTRGPWGMLNDFPFPVWPRE